MFEIADRLALHRSTVLRMLRTLENKGFLKRNPDTDMYRLGSQIWNLSVSAISNDDPARILLPEMEQLRDSLDETVSLYVIDGTNRIRVQAVQSTQAVRRVVKIGATLPMSVGAASKVLLAFADSDLCGLIVSKQEEKPVWINQLDHFRSDGYAISIEEREQGAAAIAAPIHNRAGKLAAALSVSGPVERLTLTKLQELAPIVINAAKSMGTLLNP